MKCNFKVLDILCDKVSCITAKYSFHIDVVSAQVLFNFIQVKTFPRHFIQEKSFTPSKFDRDLIKGEREEFEKKEEKCSSLPKNIKESY